MAEDDKMVLNSIEAKPHAVATGRLEQPKAFKPPFHFDGSTLVVDRDAGSDKNSARQDLNFIDSQITAIHTSFIYFEKRFRTSANISHTAMLLTLAPEGRKLLALNSYLTSHLESSFADHRGIANSVLRHLGAVSKKMDAFYDARMAKEAEKAKPIIPGERRPVISPFESTVRSTIAAAMIAMPSLNLFRDISSDAAPDQAVSQIANDNLANIIDVPGHLMNPGELAADPDKRPVQTPPESVSEQEIGAFFDVPVTSLPQEGNIRFGTTTDALKADFNITNLLSYNQAHPSEQLTLRILSQITGEQAGSAGDTWYQVVVAGVNPETPVPPEFATSEAIYVYSGILDVEQTTVTAALTATPGAPGTPGTPQPGEQGNQTPEQIPPIVPAPPPPTTGNELPAAGDPPATGTDPAPEGGGTPQPEGQPDVQPVIEVVDAGQMVLLESVRQNLYNTFSNEIRARIDAGEIWFDYDMATYAQTTEQGSVVYWAGGMAEEGGTVVGDWLQVMSELNHNGTNVIIRMNPEEMQTRPREAGFDDINFANADGGSIENWLNTFGSAINGKRIIIDLIPNWTSQTTNSSLIATVLQGAPNGAPILAVSGVRTDNGDFRIKLYASSLGTTFANMFRGQVLEEADEAFISKGVLTAFEIANIMARENLTALSGSQLTELYNQYLSQASYWAMLPADATVPLDQQPRVVDLVRNP